MNLAIIGGGNMGRAVLRAALRAFPEASVAVADTSREARAACEAVDPGRVRAFEGWRGALEAVGPGAAVILGVKPQVFPGVAAEMRASPAVASRTFISIMAGVRAATIAERLGGGRVVRTMPNLPIAHGVGLTAVCEGPGATAEDLALAERVFGACGVCVRMSEELIDAFTALAASGPAYVFYLAEAMQKAGLEIGFSMEDAQRIARGVVAGASAMMQGGVTPRDLRAQVTSPNGTTHAAISAMEHAGVHDAVVRAIVAARDRARELGA